MEVKQENPEIKIEPGQYPALNPFKIEQVYVSENSQVLSANSCTNIKQEPQDVEEMLGGNPIDISEVQASEVIEISELDRVIKNEYESCFSIKTEPETELNTQCDLPSLKSECLDSFIQPCDSMQFRELFKKSKKKKLVHQIKKITYKCPVCQKNCFSSESRTTHVTSHFAKDLVTCRFCGQFFTDKFQFLLHYFIHFVKCAKICTKNVFRKSEVHRDNNSDAYFKRTSRFIEDSKCGSEKGFYCEICFRQFKQKSYLRVHYRIHTGEKPFKCEICSKGFTQNSSLKSHYIIHTEDKPFKCEICPRQFSGKSTLKKHHLRKHQIKRFSCGICSKHFALKSDLTAHSSIHTENKPFKCGICSKKFARKIFLTRHHSRLHTTKIPNRDDVKPIICKICSKIFSRKDNLLRHMRQHTGDTPFKCEICFKEFALSSTLKEHFMIHTGDKPFKCDICSKQFRRKSALTRHSGSHTGEKPFNCAICSKGFTQKWVLKRHLAIHTQEKLLKCDICFKQFVGDKSGLKKHISIHHSKK